MTKPEGTIYLFPDFYYKKALAYLQDSEAIQPTVELVKVYNPNIITICETFKNYLNE
jgi:hypothetical protein